MAIESECSTDIGTSHIVGEDTLLARLKEIMRTPAISPLPPKSCIFKVPQVLRRHNPKAYEPDVVSIGPFHRPREQLRPMETVKRWYLRTLLTHMKICVDEFINSLLTEGITEFEKQAREFYAERLDHVSQSEFIEIMILDGCFIIQLLRNAVNPEVKDDPILKMDCMFQYVCHDLLLLENQLPWFVLSRLYSVTLKSYPGYPMFSTLLLDAFGALKSLTKNCNKVDDENGVKHILDLIRTSIVFCNKADDEIGPEIPEIPEIPSATALSEAGVTFVNGSAKNLTNIKFEHGVLTIPELSVGELTEPLFRNLIAFEQCYDGLPHKITSYAVFMDKLISSDKDIKLLSEKKIIGNWLSVEDGSKFFNRLYIDTTVKDFKYKPLCAKVNEYYEVGWHKQLEILRRDYFASPWTVISLIAGFALLVLTLLQTIFTILQ